MMSSSLPYSPKPEVSLSLTLTPTPPTPTPTPLEEALKPEERGIRLIQLLLTCAKHTSSGNLHRADECLRHISSLASVTGDSMQRLSARFASALALRLVKRWPGLHKALNYTQSSHIDHHYFDHSLFGRAFPYLGFSYTIITRTLIKAMVGERVIHLVHLGSPSPAAADVDVNFWLPLLRSFSCFPDGPPHLKLTCMNPNKACLDKLGLRLAKEAEALNIPFQFNPLNVTLRDLTLDMLNVRSGEALAFISILTLHTLLTEDDRVDVHFGNNKRSSNVNGVVVKDSKQMREFLTMIHSLSPKLLLLVEQEADHNLNRLVDRFVEGLHYYSAVFDSINAAFGAMATSTRREGERLGLEGMVGKEIENIVACEGLEREERHERYERWMVRLGRAGLRPVRIWHDHQHNNNNNYNLMEDYYGKQMMEANCSGRLLLDGYKFVNVKGSVMICWHDRPLYAVSAWTTC